MAEGREGSNLHALDVFVIPNGAEYFIAKS